MATRVGTLKAVGFMTPASLMYAVGLPWLGRHVDRAHGVGFSLPRGVWMGALLVALAGLATAVWSAALLVTDGRGTPNPIRPPVELVTRGPYGWSRNPLMVAGWVFGAGLALVLGSPSLLGIYGLIVVTGVMYVRAFEEPRLFVQFGDAYRRYAERVPRWLFR